jgi:hypothetical protein
MRSMPPAQGTDLATNGLVGRRNMGALLGSPATVGVASTVTVFAVRIRTHGCKRSSLGPLERASVTHRNSRLRVSAPHLREWCNPQSEQRDRRGLAPPAPRSRRLAWAELLRRVFAVDVLRCPRAGARMRLLATIQAPDGSLVILDYLELPSCALPTPVPVPDLDDASEEARAAPAASSSSRPSANDAFTGASWQSREVEGRGGRETGHPYR